MRSKQKTIHPAAPIFAVVTVFAAMWISCIAPSGRAEAASTVVSTFGNEVASLRLIAAAGLTNGRYDAAIAIAMAPKSHTYWQQPGEAGVPPVFSFNGSVNVAQAQVKFPTPARIDEEGIEAFGYTDKVVFPVVVTPIEPGKPAILKAAVDYAVCNKICIPAHGTATITLSPGSKGIDPPAVASALARVPVPMSAAEAREVTIARRKDAPKPTWSITWSGKAPVDDVFANAPSGFFFDTKRSGGGTFTLVADQVVAAGASAQVPVTLTFARGDHGLVVTRTLEVPGVNN